MINKAYVLFIITQTFRWSTYKNTQSYFVEFEKPNHFIGTSIEKNQSLFYF